jgi:hypothetical protein
VPALYFAFGVVALLAEIAAKDRQFVSATV